MIETVLTLGSAPLAPYATPGTEEVPESIAPFLPGHDAILLANHGALTLGADLITAYYRMETLELWAKVSLNARVLGGAKELRRQDVDKLLRMRQERR
jgi:L-fuculose-phosphate aldolase